MRARDLVGDEAFGAALHNRLAENPIRDSLTAVWFSGTQNKGEPPNLAHGATWGRLSQMGRALAHELRHVDTPSL